VRVPRSFIVAELKEAQRVTCKPQDAGILLYRILWRVVKAKSSPSPMLALVIRTGMKFNSVRMQGGRQPRERAITCKLLALSSAARSGELNTFACTNRPHILASGDYAFFAERLAASRG